ncbi:hypothetical protein [Paenibacillus sp. Soil724D2]|uniref:hypothetical protein n=1 Tax=Paenibacillus sp. (strain Soil724D2) TaxID=1736392 RepID=UPI0007152CB6|nr:hypothetical protein [Paenibacillus sp. Soil724D2]KRE33456.1 hypothetical protein ASG85_14410 [Paenibacillus sp. Soil724D2]
MIKQTVRLEDNVVAKIVDGLRTGAYDITEVNRSGESHGHMVFIETTTVRLVVGGFKIEIEGEKVRPSK